MNTSEMLRLIDGIARERNVDKELLFQDIEQALVSAARKHFNAEDTEEFICELDRVSGKLSLIREGEQVPLEALGRIPAQTAKQVMIQRFREDERDSIYNEFVERVGELVTGNAQRYEGGALIVQIGRAEGFMPRSEQIPGEQHAAGERVRCLILDVREQGNQVKIVLSRANTEFIRRLFEVEVPEVSERIIEIKAMAREPGHRTKIAVASMDSKVDAVGACVGVRGSRIKNIVDELGGEKIDIVRWNESSQVLIQNALKPAEVVEISLCFELGRATVVVNEDQLSLAIGKRGQNVRLAARLTNWDVDILTPAEYTKGLDILEEVFRGIEGVGEEEVDRLAALGVISVFDIEEVGAEYLQEQLIIGKDTADEVVAAATERAKVVAEQQQKDKEEAERIKKQQEATHAAVLAGAAPPSIEDLLGGAAAVAPPAEGEAGAGAQADQAQADAQAEAQADGDAVASPEAVEAVASGDGVAEPEAEADAATEIDQAQAEQAAPATPEAADTPVAADAGDHSAEEAEAVEEATVAQVDDQEDAQRVAEASGAEVGAEMGTEAEKG